VARILSEGAVSVVVAHVAAPLLSGAGFVQSEIKMPPLVNVTVPVGLTSPDVLAATVAVKVTISFTFEGFLDEVRLTLPAI